jgi:hypothetical protein
MLIGLDRNASVRVPSDLGWIAPPVRPDLIYDRHRSAQRIGASPIPRTASTARSSTQLPAAYPPRGSEGVLNSGYRIRVSGAHNEAFEYYLRQVMADGLHEVILN